MSELSSDLKLVDAVKFLKLYGLQPEYHSNSSEETKQLQQAILLIAQESEWENIGVCANNLKQGLEALASYLKALGYSYSFSKTEFLQNETDKPVYIKFNTRQMKYYTESYTGSSRGVLIAMQGNNEMILGTYGYFPLDLFTAA